MIEDYYKKTRVKAKHVKRVLLNRDKQHHVYVMLACDNMELLAKLAEIQEIVTKQKNTTGIDFNELYECQSISFNVDNVVLFGRLEFSEIDNNIFFTKLLDSDNGMRIPGAYDYKDNSHNLQHSFTNDPVKMIKYYHGCLGKPNNVLILYMRKEVYEKQAIRSLNVNV